MRVQTKFLVLTAILTTAWHMSASTADAQVAFSDIGKNLEYQQTGASTVVPFQNGVNAFFFARAFFYTPGALDGGTLTTPSSTLYNFNLTQPAAPPSAGYVGYQTDYLTKAAMDAAFPSNSNYTLTATGPSNPQPVSVFLGNDVYTNDIPPIDGGEL